MRNQNIMNRVELSFWDLAIPLMSKSEAVRFCIKRGYLLSKQSPKFNWLSGMVLASASLGLGMGYILGAMGASLW